jgi:methylmalonyl-CoA/ethylmalonyl-CoA epimerase
MQINKIKQIAVAVNDLDESIAFYQNILGANFVAKYDPPGLGFFDFEGVRLLLEKGAATGTIYFWVDDIDSTYEALQDKGVKFDQVPHMIFPDDEGVFGEKGGEEWMAFFKDPAGNVLGLASRK